MNYKLAIDQLRTDVTVAAFAEYSEKGSWMFLWDFPDHGISIPLCDENVTTVELLNPQPEGDGRE